MRVCILAGEAARNEIIAKSTADAEIVWVQDLDELAITEADVYMDLQFTNTPGRVEALSRLLPASVVINSVTHTSVHPSFIRINGWPGFINRPVCEIAGGNEEAGKKAMQSLGWEYKHVPDQPGMITPRVVAMIVNEAFFALEEGVSTKAEIDTAMKLGTNYPHGPFEWGEKIGLKNILELLETMNSTDPRYLPSAALKIEA